MKISRFIVKPEPPAMGEMAQLSYYHVTQTPTGFVLSKGGDELLHTSTWDELLDKTGAWPMTTEINVSDVKRQFDNVVQTAGEEANGLLSEAKVFGEIQTQEDLELVNEVIKEAKKRASALEEERKKATGPLRSALDVIYGWFREPIAVFGQVEQIMKQKVVVYHRKQSEERQKALDAAGAAAMIGNRDVAMVHMQTAADAEVQKVQGLSIKKVWTFEITDEAQIPRVFLTPNVNAITQYIREHKDQAVIPGVRIFQVEQVASRK